MTADWRRLCGRRLQYRPSTRKERRAHLKSGRYRPKLRTVCSESETSHGPDGTEGPERKSTSVRQRRRVRRGSVRWLHQRAITHPSETHLYCSLVIDRRGGEVAAAKF